MAEKDPTLEEIDAAVDVLIREHPNPTRDGRRRAWRERVTRALHRAAKRGLTKKELELTTKLKPTQVAAALGDLKDSGRVEPAGRWVYRLAPKDAKSKK